MNGMSGRFVYALYLYGGEFLPEPWSSFGGEENNIFFFFMFFIFSFLLNIVLMNYLIAEMGNAQAEAMENADEISYSAKLEFICSNFYII